MMMMIYIYKQDLAFNNLQRLICCIKYNQPTNQQLLGSDLEQITESKGNLFTQLPLNAQGN